MGGVIEAIKLHYLQQNYIMSCSISFLIISKIFWSSEKFFLVSPMQQFSGESLQSFLISSLD